MPYQAQNVSNRSIHHPDFDKYAYLKTNEFGVRLIYSIGIIAWLLTLYGYIQFFDLNPVYWIAFAPVILLLSAYYLISYSINLFYKRPDLKKHLEIVSQFKAGKERPSVDVMLPICGEPYAILNRTWTHVSELDYPNFKVHVLDDKGDPKIEEMAKEYGFNYMSRPNKGEMKKAGNLRYGFARVDSEYMIIFDADFAPLPEFINETIPYMIQDKNIAILQTPQHFEVHKSVHDRSWLEYGAGANQEDFYRLIQPSRNELGGAICVGTNAIYRRSALEEIGGTANIEHSEDVWTGVLLLSKGYKVVYKPTILAEGYCPDSFVAYFNQQYRWCKGSMSLMTNKIFWELKVPFKTKMTYISGFLYYIHSIFSYYLVFMVFVVLWNHFDAISIRNTLPFLPYMIYSFVVLPLTRSYQPRFGNGISSFAAFGSYSLALIHTFFGTSMAWTPTGSIVKKAGNYWFNILFFTNFVFFIVYTSLTAFFFEIGKIPLNNGNFAVLEFWICYNILNLGAFLIAVGHDAYIKKADA